MLLEQVSSVGVGEKKDAERVAKITNICQIFISTV